MPLRTYDIVTINTAFDDVDIDVSGKRGYIIGAVEDDAIAVFIYDLERVWCMTASDVTPTGKIDLAARDAPRGPSIRVNSKGEIVD
ncbi:MAG TPA: hypothetical protein PLD46_07840 [Hyphomicrobium sp.]|nr:hypothetical protein [Hyphomicrobium sp.]